MHTGWVRSLRDQAQEAGVPFFFKQWGEWAPIWEAGLDQPRLHSRNYCFDSPAWQVWRYGKKAAGRMLDGREWNEFPEGGGC